MFVGIGSVVNAIAVALAGVIGLFIHRYLKKDMEKAIMQMVGLSVSLIGLLGILTSALEIVDNKISESSSLLILISLVIGVILGEWLHIDDFINQLGKKIEDKLKMEGFAKGFINASLIFCIGAMAVVGSINDGLKNDPSVLFVKSSIDFITAIILSSTLGFGVIFASISILVYQGLITICAFMLSDFVVVGVLNQVCLIGYIIVMCIGLNFLEFIKIKTANMLPAMLVPIVCYGLTVFFTSI